MIARRIQTARARLDNPNRPIGVFMLVGPSGTGKTETALTLAEALYGGEQNLISINMSEFQEAHTVSTLKGSPPGYVGYGEGGVLTEAVRRRPYSVVLLDEVEKAHPRCPRNLLPGLRQGLDGGCRGPLHRLQEHHHHPDQQRLAGRDHQHVQGPGADAQCRGLEKAMRGPLTKVFPDALLNRLMVVPFYPISKEVLTRIIKLNLSRVEKRVRENHKVPFTYDEHRAGTHRPALHRTGTRRPHGGCAHHQHHAPGNRPRVPEPPGRWQRDQARPRDGEGREFHVCV